MFSIKRLDLSYAEQLYDISDRCSNDSWSLESIEDIFKYDYNYYYGVVENDVLIGYVGIMAVGDEADLINIAVLPDYRGRGLASKLMTHVMKEAIILGLQKITLEVRESNEIAIKLYSDFNFNQIDIRKGYYASPSENAVIMQTVITTIE